MEVKFSLVPRIQNTCKRCGYIWLEQTKKRKTNRSPICPFCHSAHWNTEAPLVVIRDGKSQKPPRIPTPRMLERQERVWPIIKALLEGHTYRDIAGEWGLSYQRIQQLVRPFPMVKAALLDRANGLCEVCHVAKGTDVHHLKTDLETYNNLENLRLLCRRCHVSLTNSRPENWRYCKVCGKRLKGIAVGKKITDLCRQCNAQTHNTMLKCAECGKEFARRNSYIRRALKKDLAYKTKAVYCSRQCFGNVMARQFGFLAHPENIEPSPRRHNWGHVRWLCHWFTPTEVGRMLKIPCSTVEAIKYR